MSNNLMGNSAVPGYVKLCATGILSLTYVAALSVATIDMLHDTALPSTITFILGTGVSLALTVLGIHQGASLSEGSAPNAGA